MFPSISTKLVVDEVQQLSWLEKKIEVRHEHHKQQDHKKPISVGWIILENPRELKIGAPIGACAISRIN